MSDAIFNMRPERGVNGLLDLVKYLKDFDVKEIKEIGSYAFASGEIWAKNFDSVTCIDPWEPGFDPEDIASRSNMQLVEAEFDRRSAKFKNVTKLKLTGHEASLLFEDRSCQFVYIDGCHLEACVESDLNDWIPKIIPGFFIGGHDFVKLLHKQFPGVAQAVIKKLGQPDKVFQDGSWIKRL